MLVISIMKYRNDKDLKTTVSVTEFNIIGSDSLKAKIQEVYSLYRHWYSVAGPQHLWHIDTLVFIGTWWCTEKMVKVVSLRNEAFTIRELSTVMWRDVFNGCAVLYYNLFLHMEQEGS